MPPHPEAMTIGELAERTHLAVSAIRFYESRGLVSPGRSEGGQRRYSDADLQRIRFVMVATDLGFHLSEIGRVIDRLPATGPLTAADWAGAGQEFQQELDRRIARAQRLRQHFDGEFGCD